MDVGTNPATEPSSASVDLLWIPLGAGGVGFIQFNGRVYEAIQSRRERRAPLDLFHTALEVRVPHGRFVIENAWPSPNRNTGSRGVVMEGPVFSRGLARFRVFRYEVRCWADGVIADADEAVGGPQRVSTDQDLADQLIRNVASVPKMMWGRDELGTGEMWNSNSVISWLLESSGLGTAHLQPPPGGRAPGWGAGISAAQG